MKGGMQIGIFDNKQKKKKDSNFSIDIRFSFSTKIVKKVYKP